MPNVIKPKRSNVAGNTPTTSNLASGEIGANMADQKLWINNGTQIVQIGAGKLSALGETSISSPSSGHALVYNGTNWANTTLTLENLPDAWVKRSVRVATTANITLSGTQTIDGIAVVAGDRVLVKDQTTASQNGIYVVAAGAWARSADANTISELAGAVVSVDSGTTNGGMRFDTDLKTTDTLGTTSVMFYRVLDALDTATANTANKLVLRDASGNFSAGTITAALSGNASTATALQTGRTIGMTGDVTWTSASFNGSANVTGTATLATVNANVGSFGSGAAIPVITVNAKGLITAVSTATVQGGQYFGTAAIKAIAYNSRTIAENITITAGNNGLSAGPITINNGSTVTVENNANWVIV